LRAAKRGRRVSVVLPALNEEASVGPIVAAVRTLTDSEDPLVDELVVLDSGSTDRTREVAAEAGARVVRCEQVLSDIEPVPGKGEVLWRSLAATTGDLDLGFVPALLGPLLTEPGVALHPRPLLNLRREPTSALEHTPRPIGDQAA